MYYNFIILLLFSVFTASPNTKLTTLHEEQMGSSTALDISPHEEDGDEDDDEEVSTKTQVLAEGRIEEQSSSSQDAPEDRTEIGDSMSGCDSGAEVKVEECAVEPSPDTNEEPQNSTLENREIVEAMDNLKDNVKQDHATPPGTASSGNLLDADVGALSEPELESYQVLQSWTYIFLVLISGKLMSE